VCQDRIDADGVLELRDLHADPSRECAYVKGFNKRKSSQKRSVLISVIQGTDHGQRLDVGDRSVIRLQPLDACPMVSGHVESVQWAKTTLGWVPNAVIEFALGRVDRECGVRPGLLALNPNELPGQVIERRSEVVNEIACDQGDSNRYGFDYDGHDDPPGFRLLVEANLIWAAFDERFRELYERVSVFPGPLYFGPGSDERGGCQR
jgi:hypothetical protein